jgi:hypothetical protein
MAFYEVLIFIIAAIGTVLLPVGYRIFNQYKPIPGVLIMAHGFVCLVVTIAGIFNLLT